MSGNSSGPPGGAPPTGYTGGPPAALQPGGGAPSGYNAYPGSPAPSGNSLRTGSASPYPTSSAPPQQYQAYAPAVPPNKPAPSPSPMSPTYSGYPHSSQSPAPQSYSPAPYASAPPPPQGYPQAPPYGSDPYGPPYGQPPQGYGRPPPPSPHGSSTRSAPGPEYSSQPSSHGPGYPPQNAPYPGGPARGTPGPPGPPGPQGAPYGPPGGASPAPRATEQQVAAYRQLLIGTIQEKNLQNFYPPEKLNLLVQGLANDAPAKINKIIHEWGVPTEVATDIIKLSLFDIILYVDDSGSIEFEERGVRKEQLRQIIGIVATAASTFDEDGISVRFMNSMERGDGIRNADDVNMLVSRVRFQGLTPLGTGLKNKVLDPQVVGPARAGRLQKPVLVITITDGQPAGEPLDCVANSIRYAVDEVSRTPFGRGAVSFQFSQVGNDAKARDFLSSLDEDPSIGNLIDCTSNFEVEQDEMSRAVPPVYLTRELWGLEGLADLKDLADSGDLKDLVDLADSGALVDLEGLAASGDPKDPKDPKDLAVLVDHLEDSGDRVDLQDLKGLHQVSTVAITRDLDMASEETLINPLHPAHMAQDRDMVKLLILLTRARVHHLAMGNHSRMVGTGLLLLLLLDMDNRPLVPREAIPHHRVLTDTLPLRHRGTRRT
ncbi:transcription factor RfeF, partial [Aspergillus nomiae NRRL 13137]